MPSQTQETQHACASRPLCCSFAFPCALMPQQCDPSVFFKVSLCFRRSNIHSNAPTVNFGAAPRLRGAAGTRSRVLAPCTTRATRTVAPSYCRSRIAEPLHHALRRRCRLGSTDVCSRCAPVDEEAEHRARRRGRLRGPHCTKPASAGMLLPLRLPHLFLPPLSLGKPVPSSCICFAQPRALVGANASDD